MHQRLQPLAEEAYGKPLERRHALIRLYRPGEALPEHVDGPFVSGDSLASERTVSMTLTVGGVYPEGYAGWPLCIDVDGVVERVYLPPGDGVIYSGNRHWRDTWDDVGEECFQVQAIFFWIDPERTLT
jgi:predicted 2-oxoglutarate/Fe(II)-dependent dioxygenase YbiX